MIRCWICSPIPYTSLINACVCVCLRVFKMLSKPLRLYHTLDQAAEVLSCFEVHISDAFAKRKQCKALALAELPEADVTIVETSTPKDRPTREIVSESYWRI